MNKQKTNTKISANVLCGISLTKLVRIGILLIFAAGFSINSLAQSIGDPPASGTLINLSYERGGTVDDLGEAVFNESSALFGFEAFEASEGWYLAYVPSVISGIPPGWILVQDTEPDRFAEFRAQYSIPPNTNLDFSTSGNATFVLDIINGSSLSQENESYASSG